jgi:hypothetical protein
MDLLIIPLGASIGIAMVFIFLTRRQRTGTKRHSRGRFHPVWSSGRVPRKRLRRRL